jgi:hypothetical protein
MAPRRARLQADGTSARAAAGRWAIVAARLQPADDSLR